MTVVVADKLTLISQAETDASAVTSEQADAFLAEPAGDEKKPEPTDAADADNLVSISDFFLMCVITSESG